MSVKRILAFLMFSSLSVYAAEKDKLNWIETFTLINGMQIIHTPDYVQVDFIQLPKVTMVKGSYWNGFQFPETLELIARSTRPQFVRALRESTLYIGK